MSKSLKESGSRVRRTLKKDCALIESRNFFKLAADVANPNVRVALHKNDSWQLKAVTPDKKAHSSLLDPTYQKCMLSFDATQSDQIDNKIISIFPDQNLSARDLHNYIFTHFKENPAKQFIIPTQAGKKMIVDKGYLFCANRLKNKSWQSKPGIEVGLKYFHAQLFSSRSTKNEINFIYWIKFDDQEQITHGDIVRIKK
ncbi:MAG: hypothetical protein KC505_10160 [Myxococcales bacterium]|nr:hypothetical protein [Myxococcales bacterium]USN49920.1 MAG: hypothetical protein H6731_06465 [Myxococcales bacterium]